MATPYLPPRPTPMDMSQAGGAATDPYAQIAQQLNKQLSLSQGLQQSREAATQGLKGYTQGQGSQAVATLVNPANRAEGQSPVQGLTAGANLNDTFKNQLDTSVGEAEAAGKNSTNILTTLVSLLNTKQDNARADKADARAEREVKLKEAEAAAKGIKVDDLLATRKALIDQGLDTTAVDKTLTEKGVDVMQTTKSKATGEIADLIDKVLAENTDPITGLLRLGGIIGGGKGQKVSALYNQLKAKLSLDNVKSLKGQGAVSDAERQLLENASSSINEKMGNGDFREALTSLRDELRGTSNGGVPTQVRLKSPDGQTYDVPQSEVQDALDHGYKRI